MAQKSITRPHNLVRSDEVVGVKVMNQNQENLGTIFQIVIDKISGQVVYVVLESGSFLGLGGKLFALPWNILHYNTDEEAFVINITKDRLKNAPGFDKNHWPEMSDKTWGRTITDYYGEKY